MEVPCTRFRACLTNADGSVNVWFGPTTPKGQKNNWGQTVPGRGWSVLLRLYGPEKSWFDKTWKPVDLNCRSKQFGYDRLNGVTFDLVAGQTRNA